MEVRRQLSDSMAGLLAPAAGREVQGVKEVLLQAGVDAVQQRSSDGKTALHVAVEEAHLEVVRALLGQAGSAALVLQHDMDGWLPAHWAAYFGDHLALQALLEAGHAQEQVGSISSDGQSPLDVALQMCGSCWIGSSTSPQQLQDRFQKPVSEALPVWAACELELEMQQQRGASGAASATDIAATPPNRPVEYAHVLELLHAHGVDVAGWRSGKGRLTALHMAVREGCAPSVVSTLLQLGVPAATSTGPEHGCATALHLAVATRRPDLAVCLLAGTAAVEACTSTHVERIQGIAPGSCPSLLAAQEAEAGLTPLMMAAQSGDASLLTTLLEWAGQGDLTVQDSAGLTVAAHAVAAAESDEMAVQVLQALLAVQLPSQGAPAAQLPGRSGCVTALHVACARGWERTVQLLLSAPAQALAGGSVASPDAREDTPLHVAVRGAAVVGGAAKAAPLVQLLLGAGASAAALNGQGQTPAQVLTQLRSKTLAASSDEIDELVALLGG